MARHNTNKNRRQRQKLKANYSKAREDAQLHGLITTTPEGAVRDEKVNPASQSEQQFPSLVQEAINNGWSVPDKIKSKVIARLAEPFFEDDITTDKDGNQIKVPPDRNLLKENAKVLIHADQKQFERDNPELAGKAKGGVEVNNQLNVIDPYQLYKQMLNEVKDNAHTNGKLGTTPQIPSTGADSGPG